MSGVQPWADQGAMQAQRAEFDRRALAHVDCHFGKGNRGKSVWKSLREIELGLVARGHS
jgi:hypothetical protein